MEIDHIFIRARPGAPEARALAAVGLCEGSANRHPGQGTANRRFFFHNAFIELLWLADDAEAQSAPTAPTGLWRRLGGAAAELATEPSPFGVCFRPGPDGERVAPFASWAYRPAYLPPGLAVDIADAPLAEPMWFFLAFGARPDAAPPERRQPLVHANGWREITALRVTLAPAAARSDGADAARGAGAGIELVDGVAHLLEIGFDHETAGRQHDLRPALPLILRW